MSDTGRKGGDGPVPRVPGFKRLQLAQGGSGDVRKNLLLVAAGILILALVAGCRPGG